MSIDAAQPLVMARARVPPRPKLLPYVGVLWAARKDPLGFFLKVSREHGDFVRFDAGLHPLFLVGNPDSIGQVLRHNYQNYKKSEFYYKVAPIFGEGMFVVEGERWRRKRQLAQPAFHQKVLKTFVRIMSEAAEEVMGRWEPAAESGQPIDVAREMMRVSLLIVIKAFFSTDFRGDISEMSRALTVLMRAGEQRIWSLFDFQYRLPTPANMRVARAKDTFDRTIFTLIENRRASNVVRDDLLSMFLAADSEQTGDPVTNQELRDDLMTLIIAGHETTAMSIAWAFYLMSKNPQVAHALKQELDTVLGGRTPTFEDLSKLEYTTMVVQESMRIYPPFWSMSRTAIEDDELDGYHIPAGSSLMLCPYVVHRNPAYWENPEGFDPERFSPARSARQHEFAYFPFGGGPRSCIGRHFAMMEAQIVLAVLAQRYRLDMVPGHPVEPQAMISLRPRFGLPMTVHRQP